VADGDQDWLAKAKAARQAGRLDEAAALLDRLLADQPGLAPAWNLLGLVKLESGHGDAAAESFRRAAELDPAQPFPWFNLARAYRSLGQFATELQALDEALSRDPYFLPAIVAKGLALRALDRDDEACALYRLLFDGLGDTSNFPEALRRDLDEARAHLGKRGDKALKANEQRLAKVAERFPEADLSRARAFAENAAGKRKIYQQQPTGAHFPFLPAFEFFDRKLFPWFEQLESFTEMMREELLALWAAEDPNFRPYVARPPGTPLDQWTELNHSPRWSAYFFWENGQRNEENCARCPRTAAAIESLPVLDIPGKGPTAMYSILKPRTRIPPHTGTTNARTTIHLPLVVPPGCGFRVGADVREWREGEAWAFDDTIEHEAWNDSDSPRAILIIDGWNPLLTEAEREVVRLVG
jgi:aspartate beta-hydroxylase